MPARVQFKSPNEIGETAPVARDRAEEPRSPLEPTKALDGLRPVGEDFEKPVEEPFTQTKPFTLPREAHREDGGGGFLGVRAVLDARLIAPRRRPGDERFLGFLAPCVRVFEFVKGRRNRPGRPAVHRTQASKPIFDVNALAPSAGGGHKHDGDRRRQTTDAGPAGPRPRRPRPNRCPSARIVHRDHLRR